MRPTWRIILIFLAAIGAIALSGAISGLHFGTANFWDHHGIIFLIAIAVFPRLTLLFSSVPTGGLLWWLGWIFAPRILVAFLATVEYWTQNPFLVVVAWVIAIGGESSEKYVVSQRTWHFSEMAPPRGKTVKWVDAEVVETKKPGE